MNRDDEGWVRVVWTAVRRRTGATPSPTHWAWAADIALALAMVISTLNSGYHHAVVSPDQHGPFYALNHLISVSPRDDFWAVMTAVPLAVRRRFPLAAFWACEVAIMLLHADVADSNDTAIFTFMSVLIAAYSAAIYSPYRSAMVYSLGFGAIMLAATRGGQIPNITRSFVPFLFLIPIVLGANAIGNWKQRVHDLEEERESSMLRAVEQERARIAAELHDVVSHNVSVMVVQAGAARKVLDKSPDLAREALLAVEDSGRAAMAELRHVMGLLTMTSQGGDPAGTADLAPQPGLEQIPALVERIRSGGVRVDLAIEGDVIPLPSGLDLAAYRVVQEALTNAVKHAVGALIRVTLEYSPQRLKVDVVDTGGTTSAAAATGNGRGLAGLRQRLAVYGGTLSAGPRLTGGYMVSAVIPLREGATA
ncbi:signal transduction histidine kinase [Catenulispora sp. GAS73]|uniref:sensor histidine kinase n=1 Tax=Catenulispora sp. GAS73 TaxID=3156269 RepID=UPI003515183D